MNEVVKKAESELIRISSTPNGGHLKTGEITIIMKTKKSYSMR
ncbi:hypothetical protein [Variimorphobacter saccharofermentans]|nr:hypothetical protein [Variimorphobacter saccharofermentans]